MALTKTFNLKTDVEKIKKLIDDATANISVPPYMNVKDIKEYLLNNEIAYTNFIEILDKEFEELGYIKVSDKSLGDFYILLPDLKVSNPYNIKIAHLNKEKELETLRLDQTMISNLFLEDKTKIGIMTASKDTMKTLKELKSSSFLKYDVLNQEGNTYTLKVKTILGHLVSMQVSNTTIRFSSLSLVYGCAIVGNSTFDTELGIATYSKTYPLPEVVLKKLEKHYKETQKVLKEILNKQDK